MRSSVGFDDKRCLLGVAAALAVTGLLGCGPAPGGDGDNLGGTDRRTSVETFPHARTHLECTGPVGEVGAGDYVDGGLERVQDDPVAAVRDLIEAGYRGPLPRRGYDVARSDDEWALVVVEDDGAVKVAFVVEDGVQDWGGGVGWGVTSYAACDLAELVPEVAEEAGVEVWTDATGARVPTTQVRSYPGRSTATGRTSPSCRSATSRTVSSTSATSTGRWHAPRARRTPSRCGCPPTRPTRAGGATGVRCGWCPTAARRTSCPRTAGRDRRWPSAGPARRTRSAACDPRLPSGSL